MFVIVKILITPFNYTSKGFQNYDSFWSHSLISVLRCCFIHNVEFVYHLSSSQFFSHMYLFLLKNKYHLGNKVQCFFMAEIMARRRRFALITGKFQEQKDYPPISVNGKCPLLLTEAFIN